jgi:tetratricopeptide (TPR) repeat protein
MTTVSQRPLKLFYCYAREDRALRDQLDTHLSSLRRQNRIMSWFDGEIGPGIEWEKEIDIQLLHADIILLLVTPSFMASDYCYGIEMKRALERHKAGTARVIPVILRHTYLKDAPFSSLQILPTDARPVTQWADRDEAFWDITMGIHKAILDLGILLKTKQEWFDEGNTLYYLERYAEALAAFEQAIRLDPNFINAYNNKERTLHDLKRQETKNSLRHSKTSYQLYDVFIKSGTSKVTFVEPQVFSKLKIALAQPGRGVVIEGPSGAGKTTAVEKAVEALNEESHHSAKSTSIQRLNARNPEHRSKLKTLRQWHQGIVIVDDFHRLGPELCLDLVDYLKYLADTEPVSKKLVIIGIPRTGQTLVDTSFDLATRIDVLKFGYVKDELIQRMIEQGSAALNIIFDRKDEIILAANGSLNIAQFLCFQLCLFRQITTTRDLPYLVHCDIDLAISEVIDDLDRKFGESTRRFAALGGAFDSTSLVLLEELANSNDGFVSLPSLKHKKPLLANSIEQFTNEHWMNKLYNEYSSCMQHFFFDQDIQILVIDDPQLLFYLQRLRFSILTKAVGKIPTENQRKVFICYSHENAQQLARLQVHLAPLEREGIIDLWNDTNIAAGVVWKDAIFTALKAAKVAIILVSADFLASDFIIEHELPTLLEQVKAGGTTIIPVIISHCLFATTKLGAFQSINPPNQPLLTLSIVDQEQIWKKVAEVVMQRFILNEHI